MLSKKKLFFSSVFLLFLFFSFSAFSQDTTWYTLASGNWDDPTIWTLDPSGSLPKNPDGLTPTTAVLGNSHKVVILSGRTIDVYSDTKTNASLKVSGRIDFHASIGHTFTDITGSGKIILRANNFPAGDASHFYSAGQGEGTVIFDSTGYELNTPQTFYNVEVDLDNTSDTLKLLANYQINGNLTLTHGAFKINDHNSTTLLDLVVEGNVNVTDTASISVGTANAYDGGQGYYNRFHDFTVGGDFVSYGEVRLTNQTIPDYTTQTTLGAATLHFTNASDNYFKCYNTTDLYNLHIDKGVDATYELTLYVHDKAYFALFAPNNATFTTTVAHPQHNKALWIEAGILRLKGEVVIPSLGEGGNDWSIGENAKLILDGENVEAYSTTTTGFSWTGFSHGQPNNINNGTGSQGLYIYGVLVVENGYFSTSNSAGIIYRGEASGSVQISGGEVDLNQLRLTGAAASGYYSYIQSGGIFRVNGNGEISNAAALLSLNDPNMYFGMSGGQLIVEGQSGYQYGSIDIQCSDGNFSVTGGEVICDWGATSEVNTTADIYNLSIVNGTDVDLDTTLRVVNDLSIDGTSGLNATGFDPNAAGHDLYIGGDLLFADGATFIHGNNSTIFYGAQDSHIDIGNTTSMPALIFYDLVVDKDQQSDASLFYDLGINECLTRSEAITDTIISIHNDLTISRGQFTTERYTVGLLGDLTITDGKLVYNSSLPGRVMLAGSQQQSITGSSLYSPEFGHLDLNNPNGATISTNVSLDLFTLTQGLMDINEFKFSLDTSLIVDGSGGGFSATKMIMTNGLAGDRGLEFTYSLDASTTSGTYIATYPIGIAGEYTPIEVWLENDLTASYSGTYTINPVDGFHPSILVPWVGIAIPFYWKSEVTGTIANIPAADIFLRFTHGGVAFYNFKRKYLEDYDFVNASPNNNVNSSPWIYEDIGFLTSDYFVGDNFSVVGTNVYYSRQNGFWDDRNTWSNTGHDGNRGNSEPGFNDVVIIKGDGTDNHTVTIRNNNETCSQLFVENADAGTNGVPTLNISTNTGHSFDEIHGGGLIRISYNGDIPTGDWDDFMYNDSATFEYYGGGYNIPTDFAVYPNLLITGTGTKSIPIQNILVRKNLIIDGETLLLNEGNDLIVNDSALFDNAGVLQFPTGGDPVTLTINKTIDLSGSNAANTIEVVGGGSLTSNHKLYVSDDILLAANSVINLYDAANNAVDLYFAGDYDSEVNDANTTTEISLNRLIIDKSVSTADINFLEDFSLNGATDGASSEKALYLLNGDLTLNNADLNINLTTGSAASTGNFQIPSTASLSVLNGTVNASGSKGIYLDGLMGVGDGSHWLLNGGANYIEYSASGAAEIQIDQGELRLGSQIRRNLITEDGILIFSQNSSNSTVVIGEVSATENRRGLLEVLNTGSYFGQAAGANITIVRSQAIPAEAALYLDPTTYYVGAGSSITFGNGTTAGTNMGIRSIIDLQNILVFANDTLTEWIVPLTLNENLTIQASAEFDANGLDLTVNGDFYNYGTFTPNLNTTYLSGAGNQRIYGNTSFYNLTKTSTSELWLASSNAAITITNDFDFQDGEIHDSSNTVTILGDCIFNGTHVYNTLVGDGIYFNGSAEQQLTGSGTFGKLTLENPSGLTVPTGNNFLITDALKLTSGVLSIGSNLLTLEVDAEIEEDNAFGYNNMIQTNASFTDNGVRKYFPSGAKKFIYPIGSGGKYTPVIFNVTTNTSSTGYLTVKAADEMHPSIQEDSETPELVDAENVLQYHWVVRANGFADFRAVGSMKYEPGDLLVNSSDYTDVDYITARLLNDGSGLWNKFTSSGVDEVNDSLIFDFGDVISGVGDDEITGDYTAGIDDAIPDQVPFYETNTDGSWSTGTIWTPNVSGGPRGSMVRINSGDSVTVLSNFVSSYTTEVQGVVNVGSTLGHRFGEVTGSGVIYTEREVIPAGVYDDFFSSAGGTIEYGGSTDYDVLGGYPLVNNITFSGTGLRRLPSNTITLNGDLKINGSSSLNVKNDNDQDIEIKGDLIRIGGVFDAGTALTTEISFTSTVNQTITGEFTNASTLHTLEVNNPNGITISSGVVDIAGTLNLTSGVITTSATDTLRIGITSTINPISGSASSYVNGPLTKVMSSGDDFVFPVGDAGGLGLIEVVDITGLFGVNNDVSVEYLFSNPNAIGDVTSVGSGVNTVSQSEYWSIDIAGDGQSKVDITLDGSSDIANAVSDINTELIIVGWNGTTWEQIGGTYTITGTATSGNISCNSDIDFSAAGYQYITLGSSVAITLITGTILTNDFSICSGDAASVTLSFAGGVAPWHYTLNGVAGTANTSPYVHAITPAPTVTTTYTLADITDDTPTAGSAVGNTDVIITVNSIPTPTLSSSINPSCEGEEVVLTASGGVNYEFFQGTGPAVSIQTGTATTYTSSSIAVGTTVFDIVVTNAFGCSSTLPGDQVSQVVNAAPSPTFTAEVTSACEGSTGNVYTTQTGGGITNYSWFVSSGGTITAGGTSSDNSVTVTWDNTGTQTVSVNYENAGGCTAATSVISNVTVNPLPDIGLTVSDDVICIGDAATITVTGSVSGVTYQLRDNSDDSNVGASVAGIDGDIDFTPSPITTTVYNVLATVDATSCSAELTDLSTVTVTPDNTSTLSSSVGTDAQTLCVNSTITPITYTTTGATGIASDGVDGANGLPTGVSATWAANTITISGTPSVTGVFNYSIALTGGCGTVNATGTITVNALPVITVSSTPGTICFGESSVLNATGGVTYSWTPAGELDDGAIQSPTYTRSVNPTTATPVTTTFTVTVTDANTCVNTNTIDVVVYRLPETGTQYHIGNTWAN